MHGGHDHHDHHHHHGNGGGGHLDHAAAGHNHRAAPQRVAQWQMPHRPGETEVPASQVEADLDLVEAAFVEGFFAASDATSFLRLAQVPFEAMAGDGAKLALLRVEIDAVADVGAVTPHLGGATFRYDPLPARMVSRRKRLRFVYFDGAGLRPLDLAAVRALSQPAK